MVCGAVGLLLVTPENCNSFLLLSEGAMVSRPSVFTSAQAFATSVDRWDSLAAAGICGPCLLYAANCAFKTSAVSRTRVQPSWFDTCHKFGFGVGYRSIPSANVKAQLEWTVNVTSSTVLL